MKTSFLLLIVDNEAKSFCVEGPMTTDELWNEAVVREQAKGRAVQCSSTPRLDKKVMAESYSRQTGYVCTQPGSIVQI